MADMVLHPHSTTNPTDQYRVTDYQAWLVYVNGDTSNYPFTAYDTYPEAQTAAEATNSAEPRPVAHNANARPGAYPGDSRNV